MSSTFCSTKTSPSHFVMEPTQDSMKLSEMLWPYRCLPQSTCTASNCWIGWKTMRVSRMKPPVGTFQAGSLSSCFLRNQQQHFFRNEFWYLLGQRKIRNLRKIIYYYKQFQDYLFIHEKCILFFQNVLLTNPALPQWLSWIQHTHCPFFPKSDLTFKAF